MVLTNHDPSPAASTTVNRAPSERTGERGGTNACEGASVIARSDAQIPRWMPPWSGQDGARADFPFFPR